MPVGSTSLQSVDRGDTRSAQASMSISHVVLEEKGREEEAKCASVLGRWLNNTEGSDEGSG